VEVVEAGGKEVVVARVVPSLIQLLQSQQGHIMLLWVMAEQATRGLLESMELTLHLMDLQE
jgi:hypothetical protein